jgi:hypothetical protein
MMKEDIVLWVDNRGEMLLTCKYGFAIDIEIFKISKRRMVGRNKLPFRIPIKNNKYVGEFESILFELYVRNSFFMYDASHYLQIKQLAVRQF